MAISDAILQAFPELNDDQQEAIGRTEGPLLVIAGPGSGKTLVLVLRTLNLLLQGLSDPEGILLCTFTEKAAFELRDRLSLLARKLKYQGDLSQMHVGTIHGIANEFLLRYRLEHLSGIIMRSLTNLHNCSSSSTILKKSYN